MEEEGDGLHLGFDTLGTENIKWTTRFQEEVDITVSAEVVRRSGGRGRMLGTGLCRLI